MSKEAIESYPTFVLVPESVKEALLKKEMTDELVEHTYRAQKICRIFKQEIRNEKVIADTTNKELLENAEKQFATFPWFDKKWSYPIPTSFDLRIDSYEGNKNYGSFNSTQLGTLEPEFMKDWLENRVPKDLYTVKLNEYSIKFKAWIKECESKFDQWKTEEVERRRSEGFVAPEGSGIW